MAQQPYYFDPEKLGRRRFPDNKSYRAQLNTESSQILSALFDLLPSNYPKSNSTNLGVLYRTLAREAARQQESDNYINNDKVYTDTRIQYLQQILGERLFLDQRLAPVTSNDIDYRNFLISIKDAYLAGSKKSVIEGLINNYTKLKINLKELYLEARKPGSAYGLTDTHKMIIEVFVDDLIASGMDITTINNNLSFFVNTTKPAHVLFDTKLIWSETIIINKIHDLIYGDLGGGCVPKYIYTPFNEKTVLAVSIVVVDPNNPPSTNNIYVIGSILPGDLIIYTTDGTKVIVEPGTDGTTFYGSNGRRILFSDLQIGQTILLVSVVIPGDFNFYYLPPDLVIDYDSRFYKDIYRKPAFQEFVKKQMDSKGRFPLQIATTPTTYCDRWVTDVLQPMYEDMRKDCTEKDEKAHTYSITLSPRMWSPRFSDYGLDTTNERAVLGDLYSFTMPYAPLTNGFGSPAHPSNIILSRDGTNLFSMVQTVDASTSYISIHNDSSAWNLHGELRGQWKGNDNAFDISGRGHDGTWSGNEQYAPGTSGDAFSFDASSTVKVPYSTDFDVPLSGSFTIKFKFKPASILGTQALVINNDYGSWLWRYGIWLWDDQLLVGCDSKNIVTTDANIVPGTWYNVEYHYDNGSHVVIVDGVTKTLAYTFAPPGYPPIYILPSSGGKFTLGSVDYPGHYNYYTGLLDEVKFYVYGYKMPVIGEVLKFDYYYLAGSTNYPGSTAFVFGLNYWQLPGAPISNGLGTNVLALPSDVDVTVDGTAIPGAVSALNAINGIIKLNDQTDFWVASPLGRIPQWHWDGSTIVGDVISFDYYQSGTKRYVMLFDDFARTMDDDMVFDGPDTLDDPTRVPVAPPQSLQIGYKFRADLLHHASVLNSPDTLLLNNYQKPAKRASIVNRQDSLNHYNYFFSPEFLEDDDSDIILNDKYLDKAIPPAIILNAGTPPFQKTYAYQPGLVREEKLQDIRKNHRLLMYCDLLLKEYRSGDEAVHLSSICDNSPMNFAVRFKEQVPPIEECDPWMLFDTAETMTETVSIPSNMVPNPNLRIQNENLRNNFILRDMTSTGLANASYTFYEQNRDTTNIYLPDTTRCMTIDGQTVDFPALPVMKDSSTYATPSDVIVYVDGVETLGLIQSLDATTGHVILYSQPDIPVVDNYVITQQDIDNRYIRLSKRPSDGTAVVLKQGAVGKWEGNDNALDISGRGHDGTWSGNEQYASGTSGDAFSFDASSTVKVPYSTDFDIAPSGSFTIKFKFKPASISGFQVLILSNNVDAPYWRYGIWLWNDQLMVGCDNENIVTTDANIVVGTWYDVEYRYDNGSHVVIVDSVIKTLDYTSAPPGYPPINILPIPGGKFTLGSRDYLGAECYYMGLLDEVEFYANAIPRTFNYGGDYIVLEDVIYLEPDLIPSLYPGILLRAEYETHALTDRKLDFAYQILATGTIEIIDLERSRVFDSNAVFAGRCYDGYKQVLDIKAIKHRLNDPLSDPEYINFLSDYGKGIKHIYLNKDTHQLEEHVFSGPVFESYDVSEDEISSMDSFPDALVRIADPLYQKNPLRILSNYDFLNNDAIRIRNKTVRELLPNRTFRTMEFLEALPV